MKRTEHPAYNVWSMMRQRCNDPNYDSYHHYGGRGIRVCDRWASFRKFIQDMGERPSPDHSLDRIDHNGHYEPGNCRWATSKQQARNRRCNRTLTHNGVTKCLAWWEEQTGIKWTTIRNRLDSGWPAEKALTHPVRSYNRR